VVFFKKQNLRERGNRQVTTLKLEKEGPFRGKLEDVEILSRKLEMSNS